MVLQKFCRVPPLKTTVPRYCGAAHLVWRRRGPDEAARPDEEVNVAVLVRVMDVLDE
jgi:hypothetical protein